MVAAAAPGAPAEAAPPSNAETRAPASAAAPEHDSSDGNARTLGWISVAIGGTAALVAIGTSGLMLHDKSVRDANCNAQKICTPDGASANASLDGLTWWNAGAYALSAVGFVVGAYLLITNPAETGRGTALFVAPNPSGAGVGLRSNF